MQEQHKCTTLTQVKAVTDSGWGTEGGLQGEQYLQV